MKKIIIVGAGITGLTLGYRLKKKLGNSHEIIILEKNNEAGGWIQTIEENNFLFELGPRSCRAKGNGIHTLQLIEDLGITDQVIVGNASAKYRYLYKDHKLQALPSGLFSALTSPLMRGVPKALFKERNIPALQGTDESIYDFFMRRFNRHITETFIDPLCSGIYAGDIRELSIRSCFPKIYEWEQLHGSVIRGALAKKEKEQNLSHFVQKMQKFPLFSFKKGMKTLTDTLANHLKNQIHFNKEITKIENRKKLSVHLQEGPPLECDHLYLCIPANQCRKFLENSFEMKTSSIAVACIGYNNKVFKRKGFGHLIPSKEQENMLGVVWDSSVFPEQNKNENQIRLTAMLGGSHQPEIIDKPESEIKQIVLEGLQKQMNIDAIPDFVSIHYAKNAIPQYTIGHNSRVQEMQRSFAKISENITLLGNSYHGVAVNDCIARANATATKFQTSDKLF
ncbi:MAG: protoporphyrinogen oxidase [Chlamydiota bacterium]|nr:protoporphyrinogen oxidase [Chlamydiota bacterium]